MYQSLPIFFFFFFDPVCVCAYVHACKQVCVVKTCGCSLNGNRNQLVTFKAKFMLDDKLVAYFSVSDRCLKGIV